MEAKRTIGTKAITPRQQPRHRRRFGSFLNKFKKHRFYTCLFLFPKNSEYFWGTPNYSRVLFAKQTQIGDLQARGNKNFQLKRLRKTANEVRFSIGAKQKKQASSEGFFVEQKTAPKAQFFLWWIARGSNPGPFD